MMKRVIIVICATAGVVGLLLSLRVFINLDSRIIDEKQIPTEQKLADMTSDLVVTEVVWPNAESSSFNIVVGLPTNHVTHSFTHRTCPEFAGELSILGPDNKLVGHFPISSTNAQSCNWLMNQGEALDGFILTWQRPNLLRSCTAGTTYRIRLEFEKRPESLQSLWLTYLQSQKQQEHN